MITETVLENGLIRRQSDKNVLIKNEQTGHEYVHADDLPNEERLRLGLDVYTYVETEKNAVLPIRTAIM